MVAVDCHIVLAHTAVVVHLGRCGIAAAEESLEARSAFQDVLGTGKHRNHSLDHTLAACHIGPGFSSLDTAQNDDSRGKGWEGAGD